MEMEILNIPTASRTRLQTKLRLFKSEFEKTKRDLVCNVMRSVRILRVIMLTDFLYFHLATCNRSGAVFLQQGRIIWWFGIW
jgi:hypothetical protein